MLLTVDRHNGIPAYRQIMDQVKFHIAANRLLPGEPLPSTRTLAEELGINPMTISKAYSLLEHEGVLARSPGKPLVVTTRSENTLQQTREAQLRKCFAPAVTQARQLGASAREAIPVLKALFKEQADPQEKHQP